MSRHQSYFHSLPSQNSKIKKFQKWLAPQSVGQRKPTYRDYVSLLNAVAGRSGAILEEIEMVLFANAEALVDQFVTA
jgi:hypothetical protein